MESPLKLSHSIKMAQFLRPKILIRVVFCLFAISMLAGCLPWIFPAPAPYAPKPYKASDLSFIKPGITTRTELMAVMGKPIAHRLDGRLVIYGSVQKKGVQAIYSNGFSIRGMPLEEPHYLFVWLRDDDLVERYEVVRGKKGCTQDGICITRSTEYKKTDGWWDLEKQITEKSLVLYHDASSNRARNAFPEGNSCLLYIYQKNELNDAAMSFSIDSEERNFGIVPKGFAVRICTAGRHQLNVHISSLAYPADSQFEFDCSAGEIKYFEIDSKLEYDLSHSFHSVVDIRPVHAEKGKKDLLTRTLILTE